MSFEHPNRNNESMIDVERDIMSRPSERNTTNLDLQRMKTVSYTHLDVYKRQR